MMLVNERLSESPFNKRNLLKFIFRGIPSTFDSVDEIPTQNYLNENRAMLHCYAGLRRIFDLPVKVCNGCLELRNKWLLTS